MNVKKYEDYVKPKLLEIAAWCRNGIPDNEIAKRLGISYSSFKVYKNKHPALAKALIENKERVDIMVENALFKRAIGYTYEEVTKELITEKDEYGDPVKNENGAVMKSLQVTKVVKKEVQPDVGAQQFWLKNRKRNTWSDSSEILANINGSVPIKIVDDIK